MIDFNDFVIDVQITEKVVTIRDTAYPVGSLPVSGEARFHRPGQVAYYFASGVTTAMAEKYGSSDAHLEPGDEMFRPPIGTFRLFDMITYVERHPETKDHYFAAGDQGGWPVCQDLRQQLEDNSCSGVVFPSAKQEEGINVAVWPLDGQPFGSGYFTPVPKGDNDD